ncbi:MAG: hypothetical protein K6E27_00550 [Eubacterium sp.]|nr:hypothetical protein [Eubacterium sp.]
MKNLDVIAQEFFENIEAKRLNDCEEVWLSCLNSIPSDKYVSTFYKPSFILYQAEYFSDVYDAYKDISMILYRGGRPVGIWPVCLYIKNGRIHFGSLGGPLIEPIFTDLNKDEAKRKVIRNILKALMEWCKNDDFDSCIVSQITLVDDGISQWGKMLLEYGATCSQVKWIAFADLNLSEEEIYAKIRRTNRYSVSKGETLYEVAVIDDKEKDKLSEAFKEFRRLHFNVSGRITRSEKTWNIQEESIRNNTSCSGFDFVVFIREKITKELVGAALFTATPQSGLYSVAAYDRSRFSKPVGHIIQAFSMNYMRNKGVRWYEIGERTYPGDVVNDEKLINIGKYKEGFATHIFPRILINLNSDNIVISEV